MKKTPHGVGIDTHEDGIIKTVPHYLREFDVVLPQDAQLLPAIDQRPVRPRPVIRSRHGDDRRASRVIHGEGLVAEAGFCADFGRAETRLVALKMNLPSKSSRLTEP